METVKHKNGFTLIELSIVIVIIGFIVSGIAVGTNMIKQAEIRSVITDLQQFQTAYNNFIGRYKAVPGDMTVASAYFPVGANNSLACADSATSCNGNGDGVIQYGTTASVDEQAKAWRQLALAGMISAGIIPVSDSYNGQLTIGDRAPASKLSNAGYFMGGASPTATIGNGVNSPWDDGATNAVFIGAQISSGVNSLVGSALSPADAFNIDQKIDDGIVAEGDFKGARTGNIRVEYGHESASNNTACYGSTNGNYIIATTTVACILGAALN